MKIKEEEIMNYVNESLDDIENTKKDAYKETESEDDDKEKNKDFVQLYRQHLAEIRWLAKNNAVAMEIFMFILEHMDKRNAVACSYAILEDYTGKSKATITRAIKVLKDNGFIGILKMGTCNVYIVNQEVAWTTDHDKKEYFKFNGTLIVSKKENKDYAYKKSYDLIKKLHNPKLKKEGEF